MCGCVGLYVCVCVGGCAEEQGGNQIFKRALCVMTECSTEVSHMLDICLQSELTRTSCQHILLFLRFSLLSPVFNVSFKQREGFSVQGKSTLASVSARCPTILSFSVIQTFSATSWCLFCCVHCWKH